MTYDTGSWRFYQILMCWLWFLVGSRSEAAELSEHGCESTAGLWRFVVSQLDPIIRRQSLLSLHDPEPTGVSRRAGAGFALGLGCVAALCRTALEAIVALQQQWEPEAKKDSTQQTPCWSRRENRCLTVYSTCFCKILCKLGFFPRWVFNTWNFKKL